MIKRGYVGMAFILLFGLLILFLYNKSISIEKEEVLRQQMDSLLAILDNKIDETKKILLVSSVLLSKSQNTIDCLQTQKNDFCLSHIFSAIEDMKKADIFKDINIHLHTDSLQSFMRSWNHKSQKYDDLGDIRLTLTKIKDSRISLSGTEIGRYGMFIRAISPILHKDKYIGSIETLVNFVEIDRYFEEAGIDFYVLMKNDYKDIANAVCYEDELILDNYTIINKKVNGIHFVKSANFQGTGYLKFGDRYLLYTPIIDMNGENIGHFALSWSERLANSIFKD